MIIVESFRCLSGWSLIGTRVKLLIHQVACLCELGVLVGPISYLLKLVRFGLVSTPLLSDVTLHFMITVLFKIQFSLFH